MTRLESGAVAMKREPTDLAEIAATALARAGRILDPARVRLDFPEDLPMPALDPLLLEQVLFNLLDNAASIRARHGTVALRARAYPAVTLQVEDEGEGIPPGDETRIFEKFFRVRSADRQRPGTGLGLAVCRGFVGGMGGTISAGNRTDRQGAVFTMSFPA